MILSLEESFRISQALGNENVTESSFILSMIIFGILFTPISMIFGMI
jgi:hypothetical protein